MGFLPGNFVRPGVPGVWPLSVPGAATLATGPAVLVLFLGLAGQWIAVALAQWV